MYSKEFCDIYNEYGWDYFSITMGKAILDYFKSNNIVIKKHLDLGCGTGALCDYYYKQGINTTGVDISDDMIRNDPCLVYLIVSSKAIETQVEKQDWFNLYKKMSKEEIYKLYKLLYEEEFKRLNIDEKYKNKHN